MTIRLMELLQRRIYIDPKLSKLLNDKTAREIAKGIKQFQDEPSELELTMDILGVEVSFTRKGHYEIARCSVEYLLGMSKLLFRKKSATLDNDKGVNKLYNRVKKILISIPLESI